MTELTYRTRIDDLAAVGEELSEEHLRLVAGAAGKKQTSGGGSRLDGTCTASTTYVHKDPGSGISSCETDGDED